MERLTCKDSMRVKNVVRTTKKEMDGTNNDRGTGETKIRTQLEDVNVVDALYRICHERSSRDSCECGVLKLEDVKKAEKRWKNVL